MDDFVRASLIVNTPGFEIPITRQQKVLCRTYQCQAPSHPVRAMWDVRREFELKFCPQGWGI